MARTTKQATAVLLLFFFAPSAAALEPGDAAFEALGGYQEGLFTDIGANYYTGFRLSTYQPTLNWGVHNFHFLLLNTMNSESDTELGYGALDVESLWLMPGHTLDAFAGDGPLHIVSPRLVFEHVALPGQALRGFGSEIHSDWGADVGFHFGTFTQVNPIFPEAVETIGEDVIGGYVDWMTPGGSVIAVGFDGMRDDEGDRFLTSLFGSKPMGEWEGRLAGWYDRLSGKAAGTVGVLRGAKDRYAELGVLHIPRDFNYVSERARLPSGQSVAFASWRRSRPRRGYYLEGSSGRLESTGDGSWLNSGSIGGYYRMRLRDIISSNVRATHTRSDEGETRWRLGETLRYSRRRARWDSGLALHMRQLLSSTESAAASETSGEQTYDWVAELSANYRSEAAWDAGASLRFELREEKGEPNRYSSTLELHSSTVIGFNILASGFIRAGYTWSTQQRAETYGGGVQLSIPLWWGFLFRLRGLAQKNLSEDFLALDLLPGGDFAQTTIEVFASIERRVFWGEPAPVYGRFEGFMPLGVGELWGRVFVDENGNGRFDKGEQPIGEALLVMDDGFVVETDVAGLYRYPNVAAGEHDLFLDPATYPIEYTDPNIDGIRLKLHPRQKKKVDWPLEVEP